MESFCATPGFYFYPRSPCGERQENPTQKREAKAFLSTLSLRRATPGKKAIPVWLLLISIHALLAESDEILYMLYWEVFNFYPRSPCGERLCGCCARFRCWAYFYPRSPCGERRIKVSILFTPAKFLSTLSLRRATWTALNRLLRKYHFYPRSPCGERRGQRPNWGECQTFLSTLSLRRATSKKSPPMCTIRHFYPRSPCGERHVIG